MIGTWNGNYTYGNRHQQRLIGSEKTFFKIWIAAFDGRKFSGTVQDDLLTGGTEGMGIIEGQVNGAEVSFTKKMPVHTLRDANGKRLMLNEKHPTLIYQGIVSIDKKSISGQWKFKNRIYWFGIFPIMTAKGSWEMVRV